MGSLAQKDISEKAFIRLNDVFADIFNGLIFKGRQIVKPDSLSSEDVSNQYRADDLSIHEMERDVIKLWKYCGINIISLGVENQSNADRDMPFRIVGYDGAVYRSHLLKTETKYTNMGFKQVLSKKRYPVITIVLYFNDTTGWNYPKNIKRCFNPPLPDNEVMGILDEYISDYHITVFDIGGMSLEEASVFKSDFREVAEHFIKMRNGEDYEPSTRTITHVDEFLKLMTSLTKDMNYEELIDKIHKYDSKEEISMCRIMQEAINKGRIEGTEEGIKEGIKEGVAISTVKLVERFAKINSITIEEALSRMEISKEEYNDYKLLLNQ